MEQVRYPLKTWFGVAVSVLLSLWALLDYYGAAALQSRAAPDPFGISMQGERFDAARQVLPARGIIGYLTDLKPGDDRAEAMLYGAQFAVAPRLLVSRPDQQWVLGNFTTPQDYSALGRINGLSVLKDCGNGVVVFRKATL